MDDIVIYLVDDDPALCDSLGYLFDSVGWRMQAFHDPQAFLSQYRPDQAACLLLDIRMPGMSGLEVQQSLLRDGHSLPIVFITGHGDIAMAVKAMQDGAIDFIEKPFREQTLLEAVNRAVRHIPAAHYLNRVRERHGALTQREKDVARLVALGHRNKIIAMELAISERTVQVHRQNALEKMQARSTAELVQDLVRLGEL